jgi:L-alanine-DL-glutamate epimerase-like enolase superfamily enzyme
VLAEIVTQGGARGISYAFAFSARDAAMIEACLTSVTDLAIDQDVIATEALWTKLWRSLAFVGRGGPALAALSLIDMAAWDAKARLASLSLHDLIGAAQPAIDAYGSSGSLALTPSELAAEMEGLVTSGYRAVKLKLDASPYVNVDRLREVRRVIGPDVTVFADGNQQWSEGEAVQAAICIECFHLGWLEEPVAADAVGALASVRRRISTPIATGETNFGPYDFQRMIASGAADILMPNLQRVGGITAWLRIAKAAELAGLRMASHVSHHFCLPLVAAIPNGMMLECVPWWPNPFEQDLSLVDGKVMPFEAPGFGLTWDEAKLRLFRE